MKANELMIGDWVQIVEPCKYAGAIGRVKTLIDHKDDDCAYFMVFLQNNTIHIGIEDICSDDIRPIPLTPEILEKNGFTKGYGVWVIYRHPLIKWFVLYKKEFGYAISVGESEVNINYVHELQHALKLCGIEKTIEL